jgi:hypothetical protein
VKYSAEYLSDFCRIVCPCVCVWRVNCQAPSWMIADLPDREHGRLSYWLVSWPWQVSWLTIWLSDWPTAWLTQRDIFQSHCILTRFWNMPAFIFP